MALEVMSSSISSNIKPVQPQETVQRSVEQHADAQSVSTSAKIERQVVAQTEQNGTNTQQQNAAEDEARIQAAVKRANNSLNSIHRSSCQFKYDDKTRRVSITVYDDETHEVIREIPSEEALELVQKMWEMAGLMVDEAR